LQLTGKISLKLDFMSLCQVQ